MKNLIKLILGISVSLSITSAVFATELPDPIVKYIKSTFPKASIRFDGLIELPDGTQYLPVLPLNYANIEKPEQIVKTIPANTTFVSKPDLVLFADDLALLKIIRETGSLPTFIRSNEIPLKVKLGLLPQDLVVPENLAVPTELKIILGDLKIATQDLISSNDDIDIKAGNKKVSFISTGKSATSGIPELKDFSNLVFYASDFKTNLIYVISPQTGRILKQITLPSIASDMAITADNRYILLPCFSSDSVLVIDKLNDSILKNINVGKLPISIIMAYDLDTAYVANRSSSSISVIDLKKMETIKEIQVTGMPANLAYSATSHSLFYNDADTGKIYKINISSETEEVEKIGQIDNISKLYQFDNYLFTLSRSNNSLSIFNLNNNKLEKTINIGNKPIDIKVSASGNKLYALSAESNSLSIINIPSFELSKTISLENKGFSKGISLVGNKALVFNADSYQVAIIDLVQEKIIDYLPVETTINSLVISKPLN